MRFALNPLIIRGLKGGRPKQSAHGSHEDIGPGG